MQQDKIELHLYSRKVLIKSQCSELLPNYLRFAKGVVDCEDLPLNISRENYQDSSLIMKLRNVLTRRVLKALEDEMKLDEEKYNNWYLEFGNHIKEGATTDTENSQQLLRLLRFKSSFSGEFCGLDDYVKKMKPEQKKIFFLVNQDIKLARNSPFMEPFKKPDSPPVLFLESHVDEIILKQLNEYKGFKFINIETNFEELSNDVSHRVEVNKDSGLPEADTTSFCLWIKSELEPHISKVSISKRLTTAPAVVVGDMSA
jgi:TNF receptor-associated protein 1